MKHMGYHGRRKIFTDVDRITKDNVVAVLQKALSVHTQNKTEIEYLYRYYKGEQPILQSSTRTLTSSSKLRSSIWSKS